MGNLVTHAKFEMLKAGLYDDDSDYGGMLAGAVTELMEVFEKQGHSGMSAARTVQLFQKLAMFEPLCPLTGDDDEWLEVADGIFQNKRCSHVFKENGEAYDIEGRIFREPSGVTFTSGDSRVPVTFPYTPKTEFVDVPEQPMPDMEFTEEDFKKLQALPDREPDLPFDGDDDL